MAVYEINGPLLMEMFNYGVRLLDANKAQINQLNVFPVPDGDTGTNMSLTALSSVSAVRDVRNLTAQTVAEAVARGALRGARGNSGVILSQLFRGFSTGIGSKSALDAHTLAEAFQKGVETAYKAVMKPREGTILTVARVAAEQAAKAAAKNGDVAYVMRATLEAAKVALAHTPEQLDVLKKAGVVDAGGQGLVVLYEGMLAVLEERVDETLSNVLELIPQAPSTQQPASHGVFSEDQQIEFGYCTEFFIEDLNDAVDEERAYRFRDEISAIGDSAVVVYDTDMIKVHVHSNAPDKILGMALRLGALDKIKIENMRRQHSELLGLSGEQPAAPNQAPAQGQEAAPKPMAMVAVAAGEGMKSIFRDIMVEGFVEGGQTMNPSAEDIAKACRDVCARHVYVLPNNSNIVLAANQARELVDCEIYVIPSKTIPQGVAAALAFDPDGEPQAVYEAMNEALKAVHSGQVTYAVRDSEIDGHLIKQGDIIGINDNGIECVGRDVEDTTAELVRLMAAENSCDIISLYYGSDVEQADAERLKDYLAESFSQYDVEVYEGGQPVYYYLVSVE